MILLSRGAISAPRFDEIELGIGQSVQTATTSFMSKSNG
jgi:hypothetical protein